MIISCTRAKKKRLTPSTEGLVAAGIIGAIIGGIVAYNTHKANKANAAEEERSEKQEAVKEDLNDLSTHFSQTFFNATWLKNHPLRQGSVDGKGIVGSLNHDGQFLGDPVKAVVEDGRKLDQIFTAARKMLVPYLKELHALREEAWRIYEEKGQDVALSFVKERARAIRRPHERGTLPLPVLVNGAVYRPTHGWEEEGDFYEGSASQVDAVPAMTASQLQEAIGLMKHYFVGGSGEIFKFEALGEELFYEMKPQEHRGFDRTFLEDSEVMRIFGSEYGYEHGEAHDYPAIVQGYVEEYLAHFGKELQAIARWMERSVAP